MNFIPYFQAIRSNGTDVVDGVQKWLDSIDQSQPEKVNATNEDGMTALHLAAQCNNLKIVQLLLQAGAGEYTCIELINCGQLYEMFLCYVSRAQFSISGVDKS